MNKTLSILILSIALGGCVTNNQERGTVIGAAGGGLLGSQFGSGQGQLVAIGLGVLLGAMAGDAMGENMDRPTVIVQNPGYGECSHIQNSGAQSACNRGVSERNREYQRRQEEEAYKCGRHGRCN